MIYFKSLEEVRAIREGGWRLGNILQTLKEAAKPGVSTIFIEDLANKMIAEIGGRTAFKNYPMGDGIYFPSTVCISINNEVVHGAAYPERIFQSGDIVDLDIGMEWPVDKKWRQKLNLPVNQYSKYGGFFTDTCLTVAIGPVSTAARRLLKVTRECLTRGLTAAQPGATINDIGRAVQDYAESHGYGVVRDLVGHGVGYFAHEKPDVVNFAIRPNSADNVTLKPGMVIAIEPMINIGTEDVIVADNDYTILTADNSLSAHFEHTVAILEDGNEVLTAPSDKS